MILRGLYCSCSSSYYLRLCSADFFFFFFFFFFSPTESVWLAALGSLVIFFVADAQEMFGNRHLKLGHNTRYELNSRFRKCFAHYFLPSSSKS